MNNNRLSTLGETNLPKYRESLISQAKIILQGPSNYKKDLACGGKTFIISENK